MTGSAHGTRFRGTGRSCISNVFQKETFDERTGPEGRQAEICRFAFNLNSVRHYCLSCEDERQGDFFGQDWGTTVCHELCQPERIVCTGMFVDEEGHLLAGMPERLVMKELHDEGNNHTRVMVSYRFAS